MTIEPGQHRRHFEIAKVATKPKASKSRTLSEREFERFARALEHSSKGTPLANLATVQYFQALRISEVTALHWEDLILDKQRPQQSFMQVQRSLKWLSNGEVRLELGFKNSKALSGTKMLPLFPPVYRVLHRMKKARRSQSKPPAGLIFISANRKPLSYREIQYAYDKAFRLAGLDYTGTHILRHGGCRRFHRKTADLDIVGQLLGNVNQGNVRIYTETKFEALACAVRREWKRR